MAIHYHTFVQTLECKRPKVNPKVNLGLSVIMCRCRFILGNKCTILVSDVDNGRGCAFVETRDMRNPYFLLNYGVKLNCSKK